MFRTIDDARGVANALKRLVRYARHAHNESVVTLDWRKAFAFGAIKQFEQSEWNAEFMNTAMYGITPSRFYFLDNGLLEYQKAVDGLDVVEAVTRVLLKYQMLQYRLGG